MGNEGYEMQVRTGHWWIFNPLICLNMSPLYPTEAQYVPSGPVTGLQLCLEGVLRAGVSGSDFLGP